ncbi:MAG: hypothetical protein KDK36_06345 [Leptospiraceae bacterium]|nr:hypothetical protein [Leptospiraceae bacterium]
MKKILITGTILILLNCASTSTDDFPEDKTVPPGYKKEVLDSERKVNGTTFSKGSKLIFDEEGFLRTAVLGENQTIMDLTHKEDFPHVFTKGAMIQYKEPKTTFGDPVKFPEVPKSVTIRKPIEVFGYYFGPGSSFIFPAKGKLPYLGIAIERNFTDIEVDGKKIPSGNTVLLSKDKEKIRYLEKGEWKEPK